MRLPRPHTRAVLRTRQYWIPAFLLIALWLPGANQGWYRTDTHYYAAVALDAFQRARAAPTLGESLRAFLFLRAAGEPYLNKPPLPFWIHGVFIEVFGLSLWSVRLPSLLAAIGGAWATAYAIGQLSTRRVALLSGIILATTVEYFRYTRAISLDLWMLLFMLMALAITARGLRRSSAQSIVLSGIPLGLALLCKPMVALLSPLIVALWLIQSRRARMLPPLAASILIALVVAAPWHIAAAIEYPGLFLRTYFVEQSLDRAASVSREPWWFYLRLLAESYWPWLATLVLAIIALVRGWSPASKRTRAAVTLALLWTAIWLITLSFFGGKAPRYLLVIFPFASLPSAAWLLRPTTPTTRRLGRTVLIWGAPAALTIAAIIALLPVRVHAPRDPCWDALLVELDKRPGITPQATPKAHSITANLVMLGRPWPRTARDIAANPPDLLLLHPKDSPLGPGWRIISTTREYVLAERLRTADHP